MLLSEGTLVGNRYEIQEKIGSGGMAFVYKALDTKLSRTVALKILRDDHAEDEEFIERFKVEAQAVAGIIHSNIVNVYDVGQDGRIYYIVMEYIKGRTLKDLILSDAPFGEKTALGIAYQISSALQAAHKNHIIHRDIKPQNILVSEDGAIKVTDFGIARAVTAKTISTKGGVMGSVHYFSPEQARGGYIDEKSDIYSLGIVMYEMITGEMPYDGDTSVEIALKHISDDLPPVEQSNPKASESIKAIIAKATEKKPEYRYQSVDELMVDLKKAVKDKTGEFVVQRADIENSETLQMNGSDIRLIQDEMKSRPDPDYIRQKYKSPVRHEPSEEDNAYEDEGGSDKKIIIGAVATALLIICVLSYFGVKLLFKETAPVVVLENMVGMTFEQVTAYAQNNDIKLNMSEEFNDSVKADYVISQSVDAGETVVKGMEVDILLSLGPQQYEMIDVTNIDENSVLDRLRSIPLTLSVSTDYEYSDQIAMGIVIRQSPGVGEMVQNDDTVKIYVSKGPEPKSAVVPSVTGRTEDDAKRLIERAGLVVAIERAESEQYAKGIVMAQTKVAGTELMAGTIMEIVVSSGPPAQTETETGEEGESEQPATGNNTSSRKTYNINPVNLGEDFDTVNVVISFVSDDTGNRTNLYENMVSVTSFPMSVEVTGTGKGKIQLIINQDMIWEEPVDFGEG